MDDYYKHYKSIKKVYPSIFALKIFLGNNPNLNFRDTKFKGKKILDIGFGDGRDIELFYDLGFDVFGVEPNPKVVNYTLRKFKKKKIKLEVGTNCNLNFKNDSFHYIYGMASLMYLKDKKTHLKDILSECYRVLKKKGFFLGSFTKADSHITHKGKFIDRNRIILNDSFYKIRKNQLYHVHRSNKEVEKDLSKAGFKNIKITYFNADWFGTKDSFYLFVCKK